MGAVIYCRISLDPTGERLGVERQETECRALAERLGVDIDDVIVDNDISAYSGKHRPGYEQLLKGLGERYWSHLVVWHPDRLTRTPRELESLIDVLEDSKVKVHTVSAGEYDLATPSGRMTARVVGAVARAESEQKGARQRSAARQGALRGHAYARRRVFGWQRDGIILEPAEAVAARDAVDKILAGWSLRRTAWNMPLPTSAGGRWDASRLRQYLMNPRLAGLCVYKGEIVASGNWEPLVDRPTWDLVVGVLTDPARKRARPTRRSLLGGLVFNEHGEGMICAPLHGRTVYRTKTDLVPIAYRQVDANYLDLYVVNRLFARDESWVPLADTPTKPIGMDAVEAIEAELRELAALRGAKVISVDEWMAAKKPIDARLAEAKAAVILPRAAPSRPRRPRGRLRLEWTDMPPADKRSVLRDYIERVVIAPTKRTRPRLNESVEDFLGPRVTIHWRD